MREVEREALNLAQDIDLEEKRARVRKLRSGLSDIKKSYANQPAPTLGGQIMDNLKHNSISAAKNGGIWGEVTVRQSPTQNKKVKAGSADPYDPGFWSR